MITKGEGQLGRIYERLRKRSYRKISNQFESQWQDFDHEAYVKGVRDALKAVEKQHNATLLFYRNDTLPPEWRTEVYNEIT